MTTVKKSMVINDPILERLRKQELSHEDSEIVKKRATKFLNNDYSIKLKLI